MSSKENEIDEAYDEILSVLKQLRKERGMTQKELAEACKVKQPEIARLESGKVQPNIRLLLKIAKAMDAEIIFQKK